MQVALQADAARAIKLSACKRASGCTATSGAPVMGYRTLSQVD